MTIGNKPGDGGGSDVIVLDEGVERTNALTSMNFVGAPVTVSGGAGGVVVVTISGGGGGTGYTGIVEFPADLPAAADHGSELWYVYDTPNFWPWSQRSGTYRSNGVSWSRSGNDIVQVLDTEHVMSDNADNTKKVIRELANVPTGTTVVVTEASENVDMQQVVTNKTHVDGDGSDHANVALNDTHRGSAGTDHSDVGLNNTHRGSNGTDHANVVTNDTHVAGDGSDHANVALNDTHRGSAGTDHSDVGLNNTHRASNGNDHSNVGLNNTHRGSDGTDHANVVTNDTHVAGDGSDHANVALNDTHRGSDGSDHSLANSALQDIVDDTTPQLGGNLELNGFGDILTGQTVGGSDGDLVYLSSASTWSQSDADAAATCGPVMLARRINATTVQTGGYYTTTGLTVGIHYASTTAGGITVTAPSGSGDIVRIIGYAISTTLFFFDPDKTFITVA